MNRKGFEFSFGWIFSIIIGVAVLALAIFGTTSLLDQERYVLDSETAQQVESLLNPLQTSFESTSRPGKIVFPVETRLINRCLTDGSYGEHRISIASKSGIGENFKETGLENKIQSHYIFAERILEGEEINVLVKPFNFPYKVGDMIFLWSEDYCLVQPFQDVKDDLLGLNASGLQIEEDVRACKQDSKRVCFGSGGFSNSVCDVVVEGSASSGSVKKDERRVFYEGSLLYGAIFSDADMYECSIGRLMLRTRSLAEVYSKKSQLISGSSADSCSSALQPLLEGYASLEVNNSRDLGAARVLANEINARQKPLLCSLWKERFE